MTIRNANIKIKGPGYQKTGITNTGTMTFESGTVELSDESSLTAISNSGDLTILSGNITTDGYGDAIRNSNNLTLGEAEDSSSPNYGLDTANVSTTDPYIYASYGNGIKNTGKLYFYDGKIIGSEASITKEPAGVEYLYEAIEHTDENNYHYRVLEWMRQQP